MDGKTWLQSLEQQGIKPGLERIQAVVDPAEMMYPVVQVAGTNGKGSVCHLLDGILQQHGLTVGRYTSPHLRRVNERITINSAPISDKKLYALAEHLMQQGVDLSYFEALTAIALQYFRTKVDIAILEVGMGGRFDATSVMDPQIAIITTIALEHEQYLGDTVEAIASEKAGIIKNGSTVITACTDAALAVINMQAKEMAAPVYVVGRDITWEHPGPGLFIIKGTDIYDITTRLTGVFQGQNIAIAVTAAELLGVPTSIIEAGIRNVEIPGRMERHGRFLMDGAHNPAGMQALRTSLQEVPNKQLIIVLGIMQDKNIDGIINELPAGEVIVTRSSTSCRAAPTEVISERLSAAGRSHRTVDTVPDALRKAHDMTVDGDCVVVTGSLYLVGEARSWLITSM